MSAEQMYHSVVTASGPHPAESLKLDELRAKFVKALANPPKEPELDFAPSVKAALFMMNDNSVLTLFVPAEKNLAARLAATKDADAAADELYLSVLSRRPTADERTEVAELLKKHADRRTEVLGQLAWALVSSTEFCLNH